MNGWRVLAVLLLLGNLALLGFGVLTGNSSQKAIDSPGLRAEWVGVERPWDQPVEVIRAPAPVAPAPIVMASAEAPPAAMPPVRSADPNKAFVPPPGWTAPAATS